MTHPTIVQALGQVRLADMQRRAQRDALARAARQARRVRSQPRDHAPGILVSLTDCARRLRPGPENS